MVELCNQVTAWRVLKNHKIVLLLTLTELPIKLTKLPIKKKYSLLEVEGLLGPDFKVAVLGPALGLLDFALHALWALRPCDPYNMEQSSV